MTKIKNDAPCMKGERSRNNDGQLREKEVIRILAQLRKSTILI